MGHHICYHEQHTVRFRPGYAQSDLSAWWRQQTPAKRDGCTDYPELRILNDGAISKAALSKYDKTYRDGAIASGKDAPDQFMELIPQYKCHAVLLGIKGWRAVRRVRKVVNHHIREVEETKDYKTRPKTPLKGSTLYALGVFCLSYDARDYDPMEHASFD